MVVNYPKENATEDDEWLDIAIPETYVTVLKGDKLVTVPLEGLDD